MAKKYNGYTFFHSEDGFLTFVMPIHFLEPRIGLLYMLSSAMLRNGTITMLYLYCKQKLCFAPIHFKMSLSNKNLETLKPISRQLVLSLQNDSTFSTTASITWPTSNQLSSHAKQIAQVKLAWYR